MNRLQKSSSSYIFFDYVWFCWLTSSFMSSDSFITTSCLTLSLPSHAGSSRSGLFQSVSSPWLLFIICDKLWKQLKHFGKQVLIFSSSLKSHYAFWLRIRFVVIYSFFRVKLFWLKPCLCKKVVFLHLCPEYLTSHLIFVKVIRRGGQG